MATSAWFDYNGYMANKLVQVQKAEPTANWDMMKLVKAFSDAGFAGAVGAEKHFEQFGQYEDVAPNAFFNPTEYFRAKAAQFYGKDPKAVTDLDVATIQLAIKDAGMSAWSHYEQFGNTEKVNPSNSFDTEAYMNAKLTALNNVKDGKQYTLPEVYDAFKAAGLSALEHFMLYGGNGDGEVAQKYDPAKPAIPAEFAVPEEKKVNSGGSDGNFIELTEKIDNLQGTTGNDVFVGTAATSQNMDSISGNGGEDILRLENVTTLPGVIKGVQTFSFENNSAPFTKDLSGYADLKHVVVKDAAVTTLTVAAGVDMAYTGTLTGNQTVNFKGTDGKEDAATLKFNEATFTTSAVVGAKSTTVQGIEKLTIEATGKNNVLTLDNAALTDLVIKGEGSFKAMGSANTSLGGAGTIKSIDTSDLKGGAELSLTVANFAADTAITGGVGNDTFKFNSAALGKDVVLKGGTVEGDNDTLIFGVDVDLSTAALQKAFAKFSEFETLAVTGAGIDLIVDRSLMADVKTFKVDNTGAMTVTNALNGDHFIQGGDSSAVSGGNISITMASGETGKVSLELQGGVDLVAASALQLKGTNNLDLISNNIADGGVNKIKITDAGTNLTPNTTVNVEGDTNLEITSGAVVTGSNGLNVKASAFTGDLTVTGHSGGDVVIGGKGHNIVTGGDGIDTIDLSASKGVHDAVGLTTVTTIADGDIIKGFEVGSTATTDTVFLSTAATATITSGVTLKAVVEGGKLTLDSAASASTVNELSRDIGADAKTGAGVVGHLSPDAVTSAHKGHIIVYGEDNAYLYYINNTDTTLADTDFNLIGTFEGIAAGGFEDGNVVW